MRRHVVALGCAGWLAVAALTAAPDSASTLTLAVPGRTNANVSLASHGTFVVAAWSASLPGGATDIFAAISRDGGRNFAAPLQVNSTPGDARVNGEQPPRVALIPRPSGTPAITVVWTSKSPIGTTILASRSDDGGRTFGRSAVIPAGEAPGNRGWQNMTVDAHGNVRVLWLDHRELAAPADQGAHDASRHAGHDMSQSSKKDGVAMAQLSKLYVATVGDPASARMLLGGVCYCCKTAIVTGADGAIYTAWRHVYPGNLRDMAFTVSRDAGRTFGSFVRVSEDGWQLEGCPDDGPAMAIDDTNVVHLVWPTLVSDASGKPSIGIFYAKSADGRAFTARERVPTEGLAHHPQVAAGRGALYLAWDELKDGTRRAVVARRPLAGSTATWARTVVSDNAPGIYPSMAMTSNGLLAAWTSGGQDSVIKLTAIR